MLPPCRNGWKNVWYMETEETPIQQLNEEILRMTGVIRINFPELYELLNESGQLMKRQHQSELGCVRHLSFLNKQLEEFKAVQLN